ncbi:hypothetical protein BH24DEI2_BH24DEI2_27620 [soil metagenome]
MDGFLAFLRRVPAPVRTAVLLGLYVAVGVGLERIADLPRRTWQAQPWDPASGLHVALLLAFGLRLRYLPVVFLVPFLEDVLFPVEGFGDSLTTGIISGLCIALGYWVVCFILKRRFGIDPRLTRARDVVALSVVSLAGSLYIVLVNYSVQNLLGIRSDGLFDIVMQDWAGEATGVAMLAPPLLIALRAWPWQGGQVTLTGEAHSEHLQWPGGLQLVKWAGYVGLVALCTWAAFGGLQSKGLNYTYLAFVPVLWTATRYDLARTTLVILFINVFAVIFAGQTVNTASTLALQFNLTTLTHVALLLAAVIDDRKREIDRRGRAEKRLCYEATHDSLTGLYNRACIMNELRNRLQPVQPGVTCADFKPFALLFCDLDRFKDVNDSLGHVNGDMLLIKIAGSLQDALDDVVVARAGGDEFLVLVDEAGSTKNTVTNPVAANGGRHGARAEQVARQILTALDQAYQTQGGYTVHTSVSIGIVRNSADYRKPEEILRDADIALYRAKAAGGGRYMMFDRDMYDTLVQRLALEKDLRQTVDALDIDLDVRI